MYQEMLNLVKDYSDVRTHLTDCQDQDEPEDFGCDRDDDDSLDYDRDDSDTDVDADQLVKEELQHQQKGLDDNFTFMGEGPLVPTDKNQHEESIAQLQTIELLREYLETQLGGDKLMKIYPVLLDIGDEIFKQDADWLAVQLREFLPADQVVRYAPSLMTLVFFEKQAEANGGGDEAEFSANVTLKNLSEMTAHFKKY